MSEARTPGLRDVVLIAVVVLAVVFAIALVTANVPPLSRLLGEFPITIVVLVVGTIAVLVAFARRSRA